MCREDDMIAILVTTKHRGVFFGLVSKATDLTGKTLALKDARMAIYWGTKKGVAQLAQTGPTETSRIGAKADIPCLHDITAVWRVTDEARDIWEATS